MNLRPRMNRHQEEDRRESFFDLRPEDRAAIRERAAVAGDEITSYQRSQIHQRMCQRLGLEYADFRPFESEDIVELPTAQEAEDIIWKAIGAELRNRIAECK